MSRPYHTMILLILGMSFMCTDLLHSQNQATYPPATYSYPVPMSLPVPQVNAGETLVWVQPLPTGHMTTQRPFGLPFNGGGLQQLGNLRFPNANVPPSYSLPVLRPQPRIALPGDQFTQSSTDPGWISGIVEPEPSRAKMVIRKAMKPPSRLEPASQKYSAKAVASSILEKEVDALDEEALKAAQAKAEEEAERQRALAARLQSEIDNAVSEIRKTFKTKLQKLKDEGKLERHPAIIHLRVTTQDQIQSIARQIRAKYAGQGDQ